MRDCRNGGKISLKRHINKYTVRVEPFRTVMETDFFINAIRTCEENREAEIERIEAGLEDDD